MSVIICPNCKSLLHRSGNTLVCPIGHSFDYAKEGYVNLLLANQKKSSSPGDNKQMINAREAFLSTGHYDFLIKKIQSMIEALDIISDPQEAPIQLLDLGCGSGYYTRHFFEDQPIEKTGVDISKIAIAKAASKDKKATYIVSSAFDLAIADSSIDLAINIFSPVDLDQLTRILKPGGYFIKVIPTGDHMKEVAQQVYDHFIPHQSSIKNDIEKTESFKNIKTDNITSTIHLSDQDLLNFISMTPYLYKFSPSQLDALNHLSVTLSFEIIIGQYV